jgi:Phosphate-selective porin O and P
MRSRMLHAGRRAALVFTLTLAVGGRMTAAAVTVAETPKGTLDIETRLMFWGVVAGRDAVPSGTPVQDGRVQDFLIRRGRIILRARDSSKLQLYAQFGEDNVGAKTATDDAGLRIKDLYLNYAYRPGLQVAVGQFKVPFLRQNLESGFNQLLVDRGALPGLRPAREGSRDLGGMVWGNHGGFQYRTALLDGSDQEDNNTRSSFRGTARVSYNWFTRETGLGYSGTTIGEKRVLQIGAQLDTQDRRLDGKDDSGFTTLSRNYRARAFDLFYEQPFAGRWAVTCEAAWLTRRDAYDDPATADRRIDGLYAQAGLLLPGRVGPGRLQLVGRYEDIDGDRGGVRDSRTNRTLGLNWYGRGHERALQLDYTSAREAPTALDDDLLRLSLITVF